MYIAHSIIIYVMLYYSVHIEVPAYMASVIRICISKVAGQTSGIHTRRCISIYTLIIYIIYISHICIIYNIHIRYAYIYYIAAAYTYVGKRRPLSLVNSKRVEVRNTIYFTAGPSSVMGFHDIYTYIARHIILVVPTARRIVNTYTFLYRYIS